MLILGIDPGTATTGYGFLRSDDEVEKFELLDWGWIETKKEELRGDRLIFIHQEMLRLLKKHKPDVLAIERLFFCTNAKTAMTVSEALGVIRLAAATCHVPVFDYAPMSIKLVVGGSGRADKILMKQTVRKMLSFRAPNHKKTFFDDVCDACAVAICHARKSMINLELKPSSPLLEASKGQGEVRIKKNGRR